MTFARLLSFAATLGVVSVVLPAQTPEPPQPPERWEWTIAPSVFAPSQSGTVALTGYAFPGQMTVPSAGGALDVQGRRGEWAFALGGYYLGLGQNYQNGYGYSNPGGGGLDSGATTGNQWSVQLLGLRRIARSLEIALGLAANGVQAQAHAYGTGGIGNPGPFADSTTESKTWALPVAGARWTPFDRDRWRLVLFGQAGYWGSNNKMWQLVPSVGYRIGPALEVAAQYRWLNTMYKESDAFDVFSYNVHTYGPELTLGLRF